MFRRNIGVMAVSCTLSLIATLPALGQREFEFPGFPEMPRLGLEGRMGAITSFSGGSFGRSVSMTEENGVRKITGQENGLKVYIEENPGGDLTIKVTRQYTLDQLEEIGELEPELYMHLSSIPRQTDTAEIELTVGITRTYTAESADDLKEKHPDAFEAYEKFTGGGEDDFDRLRERMRVPFAFPQRGDRGLRIQVPDGLRIHPEPKKDDSPADNKDAGEESDDDGN